MCVSTGEARSSDILKPVFKLNEMHGLLLRRSVVRECVEPGQRAHDAMQIDIQTPSENDSQPHVLRMERSDWLMIPYKSAGARQ